MPEHLDAERWALKTFRQAHPEEAATLGQDDLTPAQRLCYAIPLDECTRHPSCVGCAGFTPATRGSRG